MQDVKIKRLRLHSASGNEVAARLGVQQIVRGSRIQPSFLPSGAVLVIRRLDQLPPCNITEATGQRWMQKVQSRIDDLARRATRPAYQYVHADAQSVLFLDSVELLICYTRACLTGRHAWYWDTLFATPPGAPVDDRLLTGWSDHMEALPLALTTLSLMEAEQAVCRLTPRALRRLARQMQAVFSLPIAPHESLPLAMNHGDVPYIIPDATAVSAQVDPPWVEWLPASSTQNLSIAAQSLLGFSYVLAKRPGFVYNAHFVHRVGRWFEAESTRARGGPIHELTVATASEAIEVTPRTLHGEQATELSAQTSFAPPSSALPVPATVGADTSLSADEIGGHVKSAANEQGIPTRLGGAIYLLNLFTRLELPWGVEAIAEVNPWDFLAALTAATLGEDLLDCQGDALWGLLATLGERDPDTRWGEALAPSLTFLLRPEWLAAHQLNTITVVASQSNDGRVSLWSTEYGFMVADCPSDPDILHSMFAQFSAHGVQLIWGHGDGASPAALLPALEARIGPELAWWLRRAWPFLRFLLARTLNRDGVHLATLVQTPAMIWVSRTHLDVHLSLSQIDIDIRRAGLDQSPGWLPHWGCIVSLFFD